MPSMPGPRAGRRQLAAGSQSTGSSEPPPPPPAHGAHKPLGTGSKMQMKTIRSQSRSSSHEPLATGSKSKTTTKRKTKKKNMSAKTKAKMCPRDHVPATGGTARDKQEARTWKRRKRAIVEAPVEASQDSSDSKRWRRGRSRRPARARTVSSGSAPSGDEDRASPPSLASGGDSGGDDGAEDKSPPSDTGGTSGGDDKTPPEASPSPPASGGEEGDKTSDKRDASPQAQAKKRPADGGKRGPPAVQSKSSGSKGAEAEKGKGKGKWKTLASGRSIHPDARYSQQNPEKDGKLVARDLVEELCEWKAWPSHALLEPTGLADFAKRNICLEEEGRLPWHLIAKLPSDPSAAAWREEGWEVDVPATGGAAWG